MNIQRYQGDKIIEENFIGDEKFVRVKSSDSKKNKDSKTKNKIKSQNRNSSDDDCGRPKNGKMIITKYNSVEKVSTTVFKPMDNLDDESSSIKSSKKKVTTQNQSSKKFASTEQTLDILSSKSKNSDAFVLVTNEKSRKKQKSENILNVTTNNFPPQDSYLLSQYTQPKSVKKKIKIKFTSSMTHSNKAEDSVHYLPDSFTLSKQPSFKEKPKTDLTKPARVPSAAVPKKRASLVSIPTPIEYNYKEVIFFVKQAWQDVEKEKINGRSNILEYKRE
ncbi:rhoGEF domain-containing protein gxcJ-like isoform X3 [Aphis craccivora]|uniref:RhoGEF domain-containing protein gxcJ-like isoform X3 n=1 Tax=Aphis craccivora TaxID=307492 RepID=A0A6G0ZQ22_APHCR|nr:rhoGEF domain-containing protein gxcJ-like isoform X3 [Aphis craccivora]